MKITKKDLETAKFKINNGNDDYGFITFTPLRGMKSTNQYTVRKNGMFPLWTGETITSINKALSEGEITKIN